MFHIYEYYIVGTNEVIYVGKGSLKRCKEIKGRNRLFNELYKRFPCKMRIIEKHTDEDEAFNAEEKRIRELHDIGQAVCNNHYGGNGGVSGNRWTQQMRKRMSESNPMKDKNQRYRMSILNPMKQKHQKERMSKNNPMKNAKIAKVVGEKHRKAVIINGVNYASVKVAAENLGVSSSAVCNWCKRGMDYKGNICKYDNQQPSLTSSDSER